MEENRTERLNEAERKIIKDECKFGKSFIGVGALAALLFAVLVLLLADSPLVAAVGAVVLLFAGWLVGRVINKEMYADLAGDEKVIVVKTIDKMEMNPVADERDPSATAFRHRLSKLYAGYVVTSGRLKYPVSKETYEQLQGQQEMEVHYAPKSYTVVGVYPVGGVPERER